MNDLPELVRICQERGLRLTIEWDPNDAPARYPQEGWSVEVAGYFAYGRLEKAVAEHLERLGVGDEP